MSAPRWQHLTDPIVDNNPITVQILGICSALAITNSLTDAAIMALAVNAVIVFSNATISLLRHAIPQSVRLIVEMTLIASAVIVADEAIKAFAPGASQTLTVFVGLIITNCIVLGRAEAFAIHNPVADSLLDGLGHGIGYALVLLLVAAVRELWGAGSVFDRPILPLLSEGGRFAGNAFMNLPASALFIVAVLIWVIRSLRPRQREVSEYAGAEDV